MKRGLVTIAALVLGCGQVAPAQRTVSLIAPGGIRTAIEELIPGFEAKTGIKVVATFGTGGGTKQQVIRGEAFDVPIVQPPLQQVIGSGHVVPDSARPLARVAVGVAVRKGQPKPDISTPQALKRTLLAAKSIALPNPATGPAAGVSFMATLKQLGITEAVEPKLRRAPGGAGAMALTASGEAEIGVTFVSEMKEPGVELVGPLPREVSEVTELVGFVSTHARDREGSQMLLDYISSPGAGAIYRANGMQPGR